ncbi:MAG: serine hydrolase domain-containing protein [Gemmatimonadota bacterium]
MSRSRRRRVTVPVAVAAASVVWGCGPTTTEAPPYAALDSIVDAWADRDHASAVVLVIVDSDGLRHAHSTGVLQRYSFGGGQYPSGTELSPRGMPRIDDAEPVRAESVFDLASVSKVMATTAALMLLVDRGALDLDAPVSTYLSDFAGGGRDDITARHLLTHTSGLPQWWPSYYHAGTRDESWAWLRTQSPAWPVGTERHYSDLGFMTLGRLVEELSGARLDLRKTSLAPRCLV